jgi:hypothetical protein
VQIRCNGIAHFFQIIDTNKERFLGSRLITPFDTPNVSCPPSPAIREKEIAGEEYHAAATSRKRRVLPRLPQALNSLRGLRNLRNSVILETEEGQVGLFETQRYLNLEARMFHPEYESLTEQAVSLLCRSTRDLLLASATGLEFVVDWLDNLNHRRFNWTWKDRGVEDREQCLAECEKAVAILHEALIVFMERERCALLREMVYGRE